MAENDSFNYGRHNHCTAVSILVNFFGISIISKCSYDPAKTTQSPKVPLRTIRNSSFRRVWQTRNRNRFWRFSREPEENVESCQFPRLLLFRENLVIFGLESRNLNAIRKKTYTCLHTSVSKTGKSVNTILVVLRVVNIFIFAHYRNGV